MSAGNGGGGAMTVTDIRKHKDIDNISVDSSVRVVTVKSIRRTSL